MKLAAYPLPAKRKSVELCSAFVQAAGGEVVTDGRWRPDAVAVFYGVGDANLPVWQAVRGLGMPFVYLDNAYFDAARGTYFRATLNGLQHSGAGASDGTRLAKLGVQIEPWRTGGSYVLLCPQSEIYMRHVAGYEGDWLACALARSAGDVPVRMRPWSPDKPKLVATLRADLLAARAVITYSSAAAVGAVLAGVPVVVSVNSAAARFSSTLIDSPRRPDDDERRRWAGVLADNQFTREELCSGYAWQVLRAGSPAGLGHTTRTT